jgi:tetratricopeptide (TPR) repeat protein
VQGLIAARLDGLPPEEKRVMQEASVFGKVFWAGALDADEQALHALERKGMLRRERRSSVMGETQYAFRHVLVRDVAYGQIPRAQRAEKHVRAATWIADLGRIEDHAELVAYHYSDALELGGDVGDRARRAFRLAGDRANTLGAFAVAARHYARALELWPTDADDYPTLVAAHARAAFWADDDLDAVFDGFAALEAAGLVEEAASFAAFAAQAAWYRGRAEVGADLLARGMKLVGGAGRSPALAALLAEQARSGWFRGDYDVALDALERGLALAEELGLDDLHAGLLATQGVVALTEGRLDDARRLFNTAIDAAPAGSPVRLRALSNLATTEVIEGDLDAHVVRRAAAVADATRRGDKTTLRWLTVMEVATAVDEGRWDDVLRLAETELMRGEHYQRDSIQTSVAHVLVGRGELAKACAIRDDALAALGDGSDVQTMIPTLLNGAWISYIAGEHDHMRSLVERALPIVVGSRYRAPGAGAPGLSVISASGLAEHWRTHFDRAAITRRTVAGQLYLQGRLVEAADAWARVSPYDEAVGRWEAARALAAAGRDAEAAVQRERAFAFFRAVGARRLIELADAPLRAAAAAE